MLSEFDNLLSGAVDTFMESALAAEHTYRQPGAADFQVTGVLDWGPGVEDLRPGMAAKLWVKADQFTTAPAKRDHVIANGRAYQVVDLEYQQYGDVEIWLRIDSAEPLEQPVIP